MKQKLAVILFNLGGPSVQEDVQKFLYNLFSDPYIIGLPFGVRQGLAFLISSLRAKSAKANYALMGGGSPIVSETELQRDALELSMKQSEAYETRVFMAMRYWHPFIKDVVAEVDAYNPDKIVLLPLYPQFSSTTSLSSFDEFDRHYKGNAEVKKICCYALNDDFIKAQAELIRKHLPQAGENVRILFSAHGLPMKIVEQGDSYPKQIVACVEKIMQNVGELDYEVCYQSRVGPLKWLQPSTDETIKKAGLEGKNILLVPIAFVSEHIETLVELDQEYGELAHENNIKTYVRVPTVRADAYFISALKSEIIHALQGSETIRGDFNCEKCDRFCPKHRLKTA